MVRSHQRFFNVVQSLLDALTLSIAYFLAIVVKLQEGQADLSSHLHLFWMVPMILGTYYFMDAYSGMRSRTFPEVAFIVAKAHLGAIFMVFSVQFLLKELHFSREVSIFFACFGLILVLLQRFTIRSVLRYLRQKGYNRKHILVIGAGPVGAEFAKKVHSQRDFGYDVLGFVDDELQPGAVVHGRKVLGSLASLPELLEEETVDEVVVALSTNASRKYGDLVDACEKAGVRTRIIPDCYQFLTSSTPHIDDFYGIPLLNIRMVPLDDPFRRLLKRTFDIVVSSAAILLTSPLMVAIAIGIKLTSPGPLLFRQRRIGLNNRAFDMLKFRSMRVDTPSVAATTWTVANDPRTTKFGAFLRKTSLDELPQFFNVLFSDMSVIGPRPERPFFVDQFKEEIPKYMVKHQVKPGITGWAQVNGWRGDTSIKKRIECDIYYIENWKLRLDVKIMFLTVFRGMVNKNAY